MKIEIIQASNELHYKHAGQLFLSYAKSLPFDLDFQNFEKELLNIEQQYGPPEGAVFIAYDEEIAIACAALRKIEKGVGEVKRMYVDPKYRGQKIGKKLMIEIIEIAKEIGYFTLKLDTLDNMVEAIALYKSFGFVETSAYTYNPFENAVFMKLNL